MLSIYSPSRLVERLEHLATFGWEPEIGINAMEGSNANKQTRDQVVQWMEEAGMTVTIDRIGNIIGTYEGTEPELDSVVIGSHIDRVRTGGAYDGVYGVLAGIEVVEEMRRSHTVPRRNIRVIAFTNEEGARFQPAMRGSDVFLHPEKLEDALARPSILPGETTTLGQELARIGYLGEAEPGFPVHTYLELHIEQGPVMEKYGIPLAAVSATQGIDQWRATFQHNGKSNAVGVAVAELANSIITRAVQDPEGLDRATIGMIDVHTTRSPATRQGYTVTFHGENAHAGCFPMDMRKDALHAAAAFAEIMAKKATVEYIMAAPGQINVVPHLSTVTIVPEDWVSDMIIKQTAFGVAHAHRVGVEIHDQMVSTEVESASLTVDLRHIGLEHLHHSRDVLQIKFLELLSRHHLLGHMEELQFLRPATFNAERVAQAAAKTGDPARIMTLGAGHDGSNFANADIPAVMLAVPSRDGLSHHKNEFTSQEHLAYGVMALADLALDIAMEPGKAVNR